MDNHEPKIHKLNQALMHLKLLISRCETLNFSDEAERDLYLEKSRNALKMIEELILSQGAE